MDETIENDKICQEDVLFILLQACKIPDRAHVRKRTGEQEFVLVRNITLYQSKKGIQPVKIEGYFLMNERGDVTQINSAQFLHWRVAAEDFVDILQHSWESDQ